LFDALEVKGSPIKGVVKTINTSPLKKPLAEWPMDWPSAFYSLCADYPYFVNRPGKVSTKSEIFDRPVSADSVAGVQKFALKSPLSHQLSALTIRFFRQWFVGVLLACCITVLMLYGCS
jgi:hypothetical protein